MQPVPFGRYVLVDKLALGGMAELFLAKAQGAGGFSKTCVIKRVLPHLADDPRFVEMFLDEARLAASLNHPGIVQIFDLGQESGDYFLAMEYLAGEDLHAVQDALRTKGRAMPVALAVWLAEQAAAALHHAHERTGADGRSLGIVHRDVSPSNLLLTYDGALKLLDFGIARAEARLVKTHPDAMKGKAGYTSPEQAKGERVDRRSDVWSLGVVLHELLTGARLFPGQSIVEAALAAMQKPVPPPSALRPEVPAALDAVVLAALERDASRRTPSAEALRQALAQVRAQEPVIASLPSPGEFLVELFGQAHATERRNRGAALPVNVAPPPTDALATPGSPRTEQLRTPRGANGPQAASAGLRWALSALAALLAAGGVWAARSYLREEPPPFVATPAPAAPTPIAVVEPTNPTPTRTAEPVDAGEPPASERKAAPAPDAFLSLTSNAPVEVWLGPKRLGATPLSRVRVKPGRLSLRLKNPKLGLARTVKLELRRGAELSREVTFGKGELSVNVSPWADVWLDGEKLGQTPLAAREVWEGRHQLRLSSPLGVKELVVEVAPGKAVTVQERLP